MLQLLNMTDLSAERAVLTSARAEHVISIAAKGSFEIAATGALVQIDPEPIAKVPRFLDDDPTKTLLRDAELTLDHPGSDVIVAGVAQTPRGAAVEQLVAEVRVAKAHAAALVTGDRYWERRNGKLLPTPPEPFSRIPLTYCRAFGGQDPKDPSMHDPRNPIGRGFSMSVDMLAGLPLPNVEDPTSPLRTPVAGATVPVAGFAARPALWEPRRSLAGTYDEAWQRTRLPHWPADMDTGFFRPAAPALQLTEPLVGHEEVTLTNLSPGGQMTFRIPRRALFCLVKFSDRSRIELRPQIRRIIIEPELRTLHVLWRAELDCGPDARRVAKIIVDQRRIVRSDANAFAA